MSETFLNGRVTLLPGDMLAVLPTLPENSIDAVVTDPPYGLGFMGKAWDHGVPSSLMWVEVFRVLKPGGHLLAFAGTRTQHRMACAIEDAGFEIRDLIAWTYGSGFPKSHDVSKAIDKGAGAEREVIAPPPYKRGRATQSYSETRRVSHDYDVQPITAPATDAACRWEGWGTALKPALEPITMARKPLQGTVAANVLAHGTGALNIDACRIGYENDAPNPATNPLYRKQQGYKNGNAADAGSNSYSLKDGSGERSPVAAGRWPANLIHDGSDEVIAAFPETGPSPGNYQRSEPIGLGDGRIYGAATARSEQFGHGDSGSAARFFYTAKADSDDRLGSKHPTVKPLNLMQYLVRLVTPPGGLVLDCFAGTGTTGEAAWREGFRAVLIEREPEYQADIRRRMALCLAGPDERRRATIKAKAKPDDLTGTLFAPVAPIAAE